MTISRSQALANEMQIRRPRRSSQSPEDVVRMLLLAAPDAGRPPPEIVGAALKAAGVQINDENLIRALEEAAGARGGTPSREDVVRARSGAHDYKLGPPRDSEGSSGSEDNSSKAERPKPEIKYHAPTIPAITFNNGLAQMHKKPIQAMQLLESMRLSMPDVTAMQRMSQMQGGGSFTLPKGPEEVVRTLCQVAPDAGRPPPEVVGAALKAAGLPATDENLEKALREAKGCAPSSEDMIAARMAAEHYGAQPSGGTVVAKCEAGRFEPVQPRFRADY
ncbi:Uncharacterized protein SCF082_LOCUS39240 [Durusdinium trenchii]|uniref:Uncharacterized protein n=1 Tax=Durusdinium trenchii TaxID=1381693 RepID=A0ABP0Q2U9_9DINO